MEAPKTCIWVSSDSWLFPELCAHWVRPQAAQKKAIAGSPREQGINRH